VVNIDRIRRVLGWAPRVPLDEGLRRTQRWLSESRAA
jgi:nucleoside-diphosphate-sugar epimerase